MRGRKPVPLEQRRAEGNRGKRTLPDGDSVVIAGRVLDAPRPPTRLTREAKKVWREIVNPLAAAGRLDMIDATMLEGLVQIICRARTAAESVERDGIIVQQTRYAKDGTDYTVDVVNPAVRIERDAWQLAMRLGEQYGLTPMARMRLGLAQLQGRTLAADLEERLTGAAAGSGAREADPLAVLEANLAEADAEDAA